MNSEESSIKEAAEVEAYEARLILFEQISQRMTELGLSRSDLAARLGVSPAYVTKLLRAQENLTISSLCLVAQALEMKYLPFLVSPRGEANIPDLEGDWQLRRTPRGGVPEVFPQKAFVGLELGQASVEGTA